MATGDRTRSYLVECYWPGVNEQEFSAAVERAQMAACDLRRNGADVNVLGSILVPQDETVFWLFDGAEQDVRTASEQAGVPFERVLEALRIDLRPAREGGAVTQPVPDGD